MTTAQFRLAALIVIELLGGAYYLLTRAPQALPPIPDLSTAHPRIADHVRTSAAAVRTPDDWAALGESYVAYGYFPEGEACYRVAAALEPGNADRAAEWAFALERVGDFAGANATYERAFALGHADASGCWYLIGRNHLRTEDVPAARAAFETAGNHPSARYELARLAVRVGNAMAAIPALDKLMTEFPTAVQPPLHRHKIEALAGTPLAAVFADRATRAPGRLTTPFDRDWKRLEDTYYRLGPARELKELESLVAQGRGKDAEPRLGALQRDGWESSAADLLAEVAFQANRPADAWERATRLGVGAETKDAWHHLAAHHERSGNTTEMKRARARAYLGAGHELHWSGKPADALAAFDVAVENDPQLAAAWYYLGESNRLRGNPVAARAAYARCLAIDPDFGRAHSALTLLPR